MNNSELQLLEAVDDAARELDDIRRALRSALEAYEFERDSALSAVDGDGL